jgi:esterase/lipase superfamily enzyme
MNLWQNRTLTGCWEQEKNVPARIEYWGYDSAHDWAWWRKQIVYFIDKLLAPDTDYVI